MSHVIDRTTYDDGNRAFLQAFMARSSMTFEEAQPVLAAIFSVQGMYGIDILLTTANQLIAGNHTVSPEDVTTEDLTTYIDAANEAISPFDLEIRSTLRQSIHQSNDRERQKPERVYALVNTTSDPLMQLATTYSADEIAFIKRVLDAMFDTYNTRRSEAMVITDMQAIQLARATGDAGRRESSSQTPAGTTHSLSMSQAEAVMRRLLDEGWFEVSRKGYYSLSPRALMELRGWLVMMYNDDEEGGGTDKIKFCAACREIITVVSLGLFSSLNLGVLCLYSCTQGQRCVNRDCPGRLHDMCIRNFFRMQQAEKCPVCKADWPGDKFVGERAITSTEQPRGSRRSTNTNSQRRSGAGASIEDDGEDED